MDYFTCKQRCWCVHSISLKVSAINSRIVILKAALLWVFNYVTRQRGGVSGAGQPSVISLFSHNRWSSSRRPNVCSSSVAALTVPPWQQPQTRFTDGPLKRQCSWSGGVRGRELLPVTVTVPVMWITLVRGPCYCSMLGWDLICRLEQSVNIKQVKHFFLQPNFRY